MNGAGRDAHLVLPLDLTNVDADTAVQQALGGVGHVDILINSGGVSQRAGPGDKPDCGSAYDGDQLLWRAGVDQSGAAVDVQMVLKYLRFGLTIRSRLTYRELEEAANRFAAGLAQLGVRKGDRVALMLPNLPQSAVAYFGILKAGATVVNTNPTYTPRELKHQLHDSGAATIILMSGLYNKLAEIRRESPIKRV